MLQAVAQSQATGSPVAISLYGDLGLDELLESYGGLDISQLSITRYVGSDNASQLHAYAAPIASVTPVNDRALARAEIKAGLSLFCRYEYTPHLRIIHHQRSFFIYIYILLLVPSVLLMEL